MKITKELLREMIEEETLKSFGSDVSSKSNTTKDLKQRASDVGKKGGVDDRERGIISRIETNLAKLADLTDIKSGNVFSVLKKLNSIIEKQIAKLEGAKQDEK
jgi:hypothetical protein